MSMIADLFLPAVQAQLGAVTALLIEKGVFSIDEFEAKRAEMTTLLSDPVAMQSLRDEYAKLRSGDVS